MSVENEFQFSIDLPVRTRWSDIEMLRTSVQNCLSTVFQDVAGRDALAMVTGELLENAIKHGHWQGHEGIFRLRVWGDLHRGYISVENPVATPDAATPVFDALRWLQGFPSAEEAYQAKLIEVATAPREPGKSGLGLPRVAYEGGCQLRGELSGVVLRVTAEMSF
jgi:hypothetical protein